MTKHTYWTDTIDDKFCLSAHFNDGLIIIVASHNNANILWD